MKHQVTEEYIDMIQTLVHIEDRHLFEMMVFYFYGAMAGTHGASVESENFGNIPLNIYGIPLAPSGFGKNHTLNMIKDYIFNPFYEVFMDRTFDDAKDARFGEMADLYAKAMRKSGSITPPSTEEIFKEMENDYMALGSFNTFFEEATVAALRQLSSSVQMTNANSLNLIVDEIGSVLNDVTPALAPFLKLYDVGKMETKVLKHHKDSTRTIDLPFRTPANMLLFGEPDMLLNGSDNQEKFLDLINTGMGRRCFFCLVDSKPAISSTAEELYELASSNRNKFLDSSYWEELGNPEYHNKVIKLEKEQSLRLLNYRIENSKKALKYKSYEKLQKTELEHRHFKVMKLAGILAFIDKMDYVTDLHINIAITFAERSGLDFEKILNRPDPHEHVLNYLKENRGEKITRADIHKNVPCFRGAMAKQNNLLDLAIASGYTENTIVSKTNINGVELFTANMLIPTDLDALIISASKDLAHNYVPRETTFEKLSKFVTMKGMNFCNHHFVENHRIGDKVIEGFNMVVLDVDGTATIGSVVSALAPYKYIIYKTKSYTEESHRFRVILPLSHRIYLDSAQFSKYMQNLYNFLPFSMDEAPKDVSRKWATCDKGEAILNESEDASLLPASWFIPDTRDSETIIKDLTKYGNNGIIRYFATTQFGNRNNTLYRYARFLIDSGYKVFEEVIKKVEDLNKAFDQPIDSEELNTTVFKSIARLFEE